MAGGKAGLGVVGTAGAAAAAAGGSVHVQRNRSRVTVAAVATSKLVGTGATAVVAVCMAVTVVAAAAVVGTVATRAKARGTASTIGRGKEATLVGIVEEQVSVGAEGGTTHTAPVALASAISCSPTTSRASMVEAKEVGEGEAVTAAEEEVEAAGNAAVA
jgi:hypothetical protein